MSINNVGSFNVNPAFAVGRVMSTDADGSNQENIVFTSEGIIRQILRAEFGNEFCNDCGFEEMVASLKTGLTHHLNAQAWQHKKIFH